MGGKRLGGDAAIVREKGDLDAGTSQNLLFCLSLRREATIFDAAGKACVSEFPCQIRDRTVPPRFNRFSRKTRDNSGPLV
jgi:hypothetical protein